MNNNPNFFKKGFSLIEMIVVITIMGIIASALVPLLDTKKMKIKAAERFANEILLVQEANRNYYINGQCIADGTQNEWGYMYPAAQATPPTVGCNDLVLDNYLATTLVNPFDSAASASPTGGFTEAVIIDANTGKELRYDLTFNIPTQYSGIFQQLLPQSVLGTPVGTSVPITVSTVVPGIESSLNNLMHRDSGIHQELRTSHGSIMIHDNLDTARSKLVITDDNNDPGQMILSNGNTNTSLGTITVGNLEAGRYGVKGAGGTNNDLTIEAGNVDAAGNIRKGFVQIGVYESNGVQMGANGKIRTLVDKDGLNISSHIGANPPQIISFIGNNTDGAGVATEAGQLWLSTSDQSVVLARINSGTGEVATVDSFKVKREYTGNTIWNSPNNMTNWQNAFTDLEENDGYAVSIESDPTKLRGIIKLHGANKITNRQKNIAHITKDDAFEGPSFIGATLAMKTLQHGEKFQFVDSDGNIRNAADYYGQSCANNTGKLDIFILGVNSIIQDNHDFRTQVYVYDQPAVAASGTGTSTPAGYKTRTIKKGFNGFNAFMDIDGVLYCQNHLDAGTWTDYNDPDVSCSVVASMVCTSL